MCVYVYMCAFPACGKPLTQNTQCRISHTSVELKCRYADISMLAGGWTFSPIAAVVALKYASEHSLLVHFISFTLQTPQRRRRRRWRSMNALSDMCQCDA